MLGVSFSEIVMIAVVALIVVGPRRLPEILGTLGKWVAKLRHMTSEVRRQTGIDEILREEGLSGGINELRSMMRGGFSMPSQYGPGAGAIVPTPAAAGVVDAYGESVEYDKLRERPIEGPDSYGAIPEDLLAPAVPATAANAAPIAAALPSEHAETKESA